MTTLSEDKSEATMNSTIGIARKVVGDVSKSFRDEWKFNPSTAVRAALGYWMMQSVRHLSAITILCEEHDLSMIADVHYRQMLEILLQVRKFLSYDENEWDEIAQKVSAWGCIEYLEKLEPVKDHPTVKEAYREAMDQLDKYDQELLRKIRSERSNRQWYWFGRSFSGIARGVSKSGEDLKTVYHLQSAQMHGSWGLTFEVANPEPGSLDFKGYPDKATMYEWAAELVDRSTQTFLNIWNEIASMVGAPTVELLG